MEKIGNAQIPDEVDLTLIRELRMDARKSYLELATTLGLNPATVSRRLQRLLNKGTITFVTVADHVTLGYLTEARLGIKTSPGRIDTVATQLVSLPRVQTVIGTAGHYDLMAIMMVRDIGDLREFVHERLGGITDITNVEMELEVERFKYDWTEKGVNLLDSNSPPACFALDDLDLSIIRELELHPRATITRLAKTLGIGRMTVSKKLQLLFDAGVIRIICIPDLSTLGYSIRTYLRLKVACQKLREVARILASLPNITHVMMTTGEFQLSASPIFKDREDMHRFLTDRLSAIDGIIQHEMVMFTKIYKRWFQLAAESGENLK